MIRTEKREDRERKDKAWRDALQAALEEDILILTSEDSTDSGTEETQKKNKLSNLKMVNTVEEEWLRYGINSNYLMNKCVTNNLISRQEKDKAK